MGKRHSDEFEYLRAEMTPWEEHLWFDFIRTLPYHVKRNYQIEEGVIAPFYSQAMGVIIETYDSKNHSDEAIRLESERDALYAEYDCKIIRFSDEEIMNDFDRVCSDILKAFEGGYTYSY